jgi:hypothetical protein
MIKQCLVALAAVTVSVLSSGCGTPAGLFPVSGKVLYKGEPASGAVVYFHRVGGSADPNQSIPYGVVDEGGRFDLACDGLGYGCPPGNYAVLVEWRDLAGDGVTPVKSKGKIKLVKRSRVRSGADRLKGRYFDINKPLLHAEVQAGSTPSPAFELTD